MPVSGKIESKKITGKVGGTYNIEVRFRSPDELRIKAAFNRLYELRGYSAYEVALLNGFVGTEEEWLASLTGKDGTGVTVASVTESTKDGGSNVITFSDGTSVTIKNGSGLGLSITEKTLTETIHVSAEDVFVEYDSLGNPTYYTETFYLANPVISVLNAVWTEDGDLHDFVPVVTADRGIRFEGTVPYEDADGDGNLVMVTYTAQTVETDSTLKFENGLLCVNTTEDVEKGNILPVTSNAVHNTVGMIEEELETI